MFWNNLHKNVLEKSKICKVYMRHQMDATWFSKKYSNTALKTNEDKTQRKSVSSGQSNRQKKKKTHKKKHSWPDSHLKHD